MDPALRQLVRQRAQDRCEYCGLPQSATPFITFHVEHLLPRQHGGPDELANLARPAIGVIEPKARISRRLIPTRSNRSRSSIHVGNFSAVDGVVQGLTPIGRGTVRLLNRNQIDRGRLRLSLDE